MKLNLSFVPYNGVDKEFRVVCFGEKEDLIQLSKNVQLHNFCTNVFMTEDKKESNS